MRVVIQRVKRASVSIEQQKFSSIGSGLLVLLGIEEGDDKNAIDSLTSKICNLRIFSDEDGMMNLSVKEIQGEVLVVSQFTLLASTKKGNRPSFTKAEKPGPARLLYENFVIQMELELARRIYTGVFAADMEVELVNDGPVTIIMDSRSKD